MATTSIVVPSRGGATRLPQLLACLTAQTDPDWEAIIVLDGDIDNSAAVVDAYDDPRVRTIVFDENRGRVAALNAGFSASTGDVLVRCDDDLHPRPDYVASHVRAHAGIEPRGVVGLSRNVLPDTPYARAYGIAMDEVFRRHAYATPAGSRWRYWAGNVSVTRETWDRVGPYDTDYRAYGWEDVDYGYRIHALGIPVILDPALETDHHGAATTTESRATRAFLSGAARALFESKHGPSALPASASDTGLWNRLIGVSARAASRRRVSTTARLIDRALPFLPRPVAHKAVAWAVEGAARGGELHPDQTTTDI